MAWTVGLAAVLILAACSGRAPAGEPTTQPGAAQSTHTPVLRTATAAPPITAEPLTEPGSDWLAHSVPGVQFALPPGWQEQAAGRWQGPTGFAHIEALPPGGAPAAACILAANREKPGRYGQLPEIRDLYQDGQHIGCLVLPSPDQPVERAGESLLMVWPPAQPPRPGWSFAADRMHIEAVASSLRLTGESPTAQCDLAPQPQTGQVVDSGGLRITEFAVASAPEGAVCDPLKSAMAFNAAAAGGEAAEITAQILAEQFSDTRLANLNARLAPFAVRIRTSERRFVVEQRGEKLHSNLSWIGPLTVNASGSDFRLPVVDGYDAGTFVLSPGGLERQEAWDILLYDRVFPVFVGDDLISLAYDYERYLRQVNAPALLNVLRGGEVIETWSVSGATPDGGPARGLWAWDGRWLLELPGVLVEEGQILNDRLGYSEMFAWNLVGGQPFYFYREEGQVRISYSGETLPTTYDDVLYQPLGGSAILLRMKAYESGLFFYARRGGSWYYVTIQP